MSKVWRVIRGWLNAIDPNWMVIVENDKGERRGVRQGDYWTGRHAGFKRVK